MTIHGDVHAGSNYTTWSQCRSRDINENDALSENLIICGKINR